MHQINELLEQEQELRGCTNAGADHDAIERICAQRLRDRGSAVSPRSTKHSCASYPSALRVPSSAVSCAMSFSGVNPGQRL